MSDVYQVNVIDPSNGYQWICTDDEEHVADWVWRTLKRLHSQQRYGDVRVQVWPQHE